MFTHQTAKMKVPIEDFYRSTSIAQLVFSKKGRRNDQNLGSPTRPMTQQLAHQRAQSHKQLLLNEFNWVDQFQAMASKNNIKVHTNYMEYFDRPIDYDVRGYTYSHKQRPFKVYEGQTPIV